MSKFNQDPLKQDIKRSMEGKVTDELLEIWVINNRDEWSDTAFEVIKEILQNRLGEIPSQESSRKINPTSSHFEKISFIANEQSPTILNDTIISSPNKKVNENSLSSDSLLEVLQKQNELLEEIRTLIDDSLDYDNESETLNNFLSKITDIDMPIGSMMVFIFKWFIASIPLVIVLTLIYYFLFLWILK